MRYDVGPFCIYYWSLYTKQGLFLSFRIGQANRNREINLVKLMFRVIDCGVTIPSVYYLWLTQSLVIVHSFFEFANLVQNLT